MNKVRALLVTGVFAVITPLTETAFASPPAPPMSIKILASSGPQTLSMNKVLTLRLKVSGVKLTITHLGKKPQDSEAHFQIYLDTIPKDAQKKADLHHWLASVAATTIPLKLSSGVLGNKKGKHTIYVTLAKNNNVLYNTKAAALVFTIK